MKKINLFLSSLLCLSHITLQSINIPQCKDSFISLSLKQTDGRIDPTTQVTICHDNDYLYVNWQNVDTDVISTYTKCNDPLYNQDAVQIFLSSPLSYKQVSPKGVLFLSDITNPSGNCSKFSGNLQSCSLAEYSGRIIKNGWEAHLKVKLQFLLRNQKTNYLMGNIFRIDKTTNKPTRYLAMNPTGTPTPCFHVPGKFQKFVLLGINQNLLSQN